MMNKFNIGDKVIVMGHRDDMNAHVLTPIKIFLI